jgi:hypothetical protein
MEDIVKENATKQGSLRRGCRIGRFTIDLKATTSVTSLL